MRDAEAEWRGKQKRLLEWLRKEKDACPKPSAASFQWELARGAVHSCSTTSSTLPTLVCSLRQRPENSPRLGLAQRWTASRECTLHYRPTMHLWPSAVITWMIALTPASPSVFLELYSATHRKCLLAIGCGHDRHDSLRLQPVCTTQAQPSPQSAVAPVRHGCAVLRRPPDALPVPLQIG
jgi:hypothetical protein